MCLRCQDGIVTGELIHDLIAYEERPDADSEFVQLLRGAFRAEAFARMTDSYPPIGHTFPRYAGE